MSAVHVVVPAGIDDPARPSGGNVYDRRVCNGLAELRWEVTEHHVWGPWPDAHLRGLAALADAMAAMRDDSVVLIDGLVASVSAAVLVPAARRLRIVVLVHLPLATKGEGAVLGAARAVVTTSAWARTQLLDVYPLDPSVVHVVEPGAERADVVTGSPRGDNLLCVAPVSRHKGHDVLVCALGSMRDLAWHCRLVGSLDREPRFVERVRQQIAHHGLADRVDLCGALTRPDVTRAYARADLLVHPSRGETYGMVITEALAHGLPVVATDVGGVREAIGDTTIGTPGISVSVDDPSGLAAALRTWLGDERTRRRLRCAAFHRRRTLASWNVTATRMAHLLEAVVQ